MTKKYNRIDIRVDNSCEMASVYLNGNLIMCGNFWDFHPGCHGINEYGDFKGYRDLARAIALKVGGKCEIFTNTFSYE